jgi:L-aspartate oxidase
LSSCLKYAIDIRKDPIPITPVAHYMIGGVISDLSGRTTVRGLYAIGEVARTGVHGANRLASNSLLECAVFSIQSAKAVFLDQQDNPELWNDPIKPFLPRNDVRVIQQTELDKSKLQHLMWNWVGLVRNRNSLLNAIEDLKNVPFLFEESFSVERFELFSLKNLARLISLSALQREESRGSHYRSDFPFPNDSYLYPIKRVYHRDRLYLT